MLTLVILALSIAAPEAAKDNANDFKLELLQFKECDLKIEKPKVVCKGMNATITITLPSIDNITMVPAYIKTRGPVIPCLRGNMVQMIQSQLVSRVFSVHVPVHSYGKSYVDICVSDCDCHEVQLYGIPAPITLIPPVLTVILAVATRQVLLALSFGLYSAAFIACAFNPINAFIQTFDVYILLPFLDPSKSAVVVFCAIMSGMIEIIEKGGGANGLANQIFKLAKNSFHAAIVTTVLGVAFFFDDFASTMICGKSLGPLVAELGLSVQKFSFIVHMMSVLVASVCPMSSWAGIQIGYIESAFLLAGKEVSGFSYMVQSIPYRFFSVGCLLAVVLYVALNREVAPMLAYEAAEQTKLKTRQRKPSYVADKPSTPERWFNAVIPLLILTIISVIRMYFDGKETIENSGTEIEYNFINCISKSNSINSLTIGASTGLCVTVIMIVAQRIMTMDKCLVYFVDGVKNMADPVLILILAWGLGVAMQDIHTSEYIAGALGGNMPVEYFPAVVAIIGYGMSYASGSCMGTQGILFPLIVPVVVALTDDETVYIKTVAAALGSSVFGNLCSPIADTTIAGILFTGCPMLDHIKVQTTFAVPLAVLAIIFGDLFVGMGLYHWSVSYLIIILFTLLIFLLFGRSASLKGASPADKLYGYIRKGGARCRSGESQSVSDDSDESEKLLKGVNGVAVNYTL